MLSPLTSRVKTSVLLGTNSFGKLNNSSGFSIASIGLPAATRPSKGTSITLSSFLIYSFGTLISIVLNLLSVWLIYPFLVKFFKWTNIVAVLLKLHKAHNSRIVGAYPFSATNFLITVRISFCLLVNFSILITS